MLNIVSLILGGALLVAGRKLFWLFVGVAGFVTGLQLATRFSQGSDVLAILIGLGVGVLFALLAIFLQTIAIGAAGFFAGGYVLTVLAGMLGNNGGTFSLIVYIIGGILGVILVIFLFDWALITLSSLAGASLVIQAFFPRGATGGVLFIILFLAGVLFQGSILRRERAVAAS
jgi:hypothetical protein